MALKDTLKQQAPGLRRAVRRASRLRWGAKRNVLRYTGASLRDPVSLRYLLWDPEVESHSYELANRDEVIAFCARAFGLDEGEARRYADEALHDPALTSDLRRRTRWAFDLKTQPPLGQRLIWWILVRARRPRLVVETGIYEGLGSLVVLAALRRNAEDGEPDGRLISVDSDAHAGRLVPEELKRRWEKAVGFTSDVLEGALGDREVDILIHDTPHTEEIQEHEFGVALRRAAPVLTLIDGSGGRVSTLRTLARRHGTTLHHVTPIPRDHPYRPRGVDVATFTRDLPTPAPTSRSPARVRGARAS
jgi:Methyltransferase domain